MDYTVGYGTRELAREEPSPVRQQNETEMSRQARMRPADKSPAAVQAALDAIVAEQAIAATRLLARQEAVDALQKGYHPPAKVQEALNLRSWRRSTWSNSPGCGQGWRRPC